MAEVSESVNYKTVDVVKKKTPAGAVGKFIGVSFGIFGVIIGAALCLTIIGILIGFPLMVASIGLIVGAQGFQQVKCAHCDKRTKVLKTKENFDCPKCRQLTVINWK